MSIYPQEKFIQLTDKRKLEVVYQLAQKIEASWSKIKFREKSLEQLSCYLIWMGFSKNQEIKKIGNLQRLLGSRLTEQTFMNVLVPLERALDRRLKDEHIIQVTDKDRSEVTLERLPLVVVLDHLRSAFNVGSIFRTADILGVAHIYLVGYTATPNEASVRKAAMGSHKFVSWSHAPNLDELWPQLKQEGFSLMGLETSPQAVSLTEYAASEKLAIVLGNERFGLSPGVLEQLDTVVSIPVRGAKNSLNVAAAFAICGFEITKQWL